MEVPRIYNGDLQALDDDWWHLHMSLPDTIKQTHNTDKFFIGLRNLKNVDSEPSFSVQPQFTLVRKQGIGLKNAAARAKSRVKSLVNTPLGHPARTSTVQQQQAKKQAMGDHNPQTGV